MSSLGFSEYAESGNLNTNSNSNGKIYNRRNTNTTGNRTLKIPRNQSLDDTRSNGNGERGLLQSSNGNVTGITNENGTNQGMIQQAGQKIKQIKDYIENIHRKGGEDSDADENEMDSVLPAYPAQGMGVYATNVTSQGIIRGPDNSVSSNNGVVRKTTQMNSLNPASSYSSTLLEGMDPVVANANANANNPNLQLLPGATAGESGRFSSPPHFTTPYGDSTRNVDPSGRTNVTNSNSNSNSSRPTTSTYASQYYEQFVPYAETLANQLAGGTAASSTGGSMSGTNAALIEKLNYIIHMMEDKKDEKTGHVIEELVLYCFLGIFIIFIVDTFTNAIPGNGRVGGGGGGAGGRGFSMFGGRQTAQYRR